MNVQQLAELFIIEEDINEIGKYYTIYHIFKFNRIFYSKKDAIKKAIELLNKNEWWF